MSVSSALSDMASIPQLIASGNCEEALKQISKKKQLAVKSEDDGTTPLHVALEHNHTAFAVTLVKTYKANICAKDGESRTPMHIAAARGNLEFMDQVLSKRSTVVPDDRGNTILHALARSQVANMELLNRVASTLVSAGVDLNALNADGETCLHLAAYHGNELFVLFVVNQKGVDYDIQTRYDTSAIPTREIVIDIEIERERERERERSLTR